MGVFLEMFEELGTTEMMGTGASIHWDVVSWWHWCLAAFLSPENVEKNQPSIWEQQGKGSEELKFFFAKDKGGTKKCKQDLSIKLIKLHYYGLCLFINNCCSTGKIRNSPKSNNRAVADSG